MPDPEAILDSLPGLVLFLDMNRQIRYASAASADWTGCTPARMHGRTVADFFSASDSRALEVQLDAVYRGEARQLRLTGGDQSSRTQVPEPAGVAGTIVASGVWAQVDLVPLVRSGHVLGVHACFIEVTDVPHIRSGAATVPGSGLDEDHEELLLLRRRALDTIFELGVRCAQLGKDHPEVSERANGMITALDALMTDLVESLPPAMPTP